LDLIDGGLFFGKRRGRFPKKGSNRARFAGCFSENAVSGKTILVYFAPQARNSAEGFLVLQSKTIC
jgi:hypothetical protein